MDIANISLLSAFQKIKLAKKENENEKNCWPADAGAPSIDDGGQSRKFHNNKNLAIASILALSAGFSGGALSAPVTVFSTDFDGSLPSEISPGTATLTGVQGYAGLGPSGNQFGGNFLRSETGNTVTLTLNSLPTHDTISLAFLFAAIDSLDGTGTFPSGDFFKIVFDGTTLFSESFANALPSQIQSYVPPAGVELARRVDLGFSGPGSFFTDSAYNFGADPLFANFPHTASSATIEFFIFGEGNQSLGDESWAMDNLRVSVTTQAQAVPEPGPLALLVLPVLAYWQRSNVGWKHSKKIRVKDIRGLQEIEWVILGHFKSLGVCR